MLDFRCHVSDAEKAAPLFSRQIEPYLRDQKSGAKFFVPETQKIGALRQTRKPYPDKNYFIIFGNPAKYVKRGDRIIVVIGDLNMGNLIVERPSPAENPALSPDRARVPSERFPLLLEVCLRRCLRCRCS